MLETALAVKLGFAIILALKMRGLRPTSSRELGHAFLGWFVVAGVFASALGWIVYELPEGAVYPCLQHPIPELLAMILVPIARPIAARIALEQGRHR